MNLDNYQWAEYRPPCPVLNGHWNIAFNLVCPVLFDEKVLYSKNQFNQSKNFKSAEVKVKKPPRTPVRTVLRQLDKDIAEMRRVIIEKLKNGHGDTDYPTLYKIILDAGVLQYKSGAVMTYNAFYQNVSDIRSALGLGRISDAIKTKTEKIVDLFDQGKTAQEIIELLDTNIPYITKSLVKHGRKEPRKYDVVAKKSKARVIESKYRNGRSIERITQDTDSSIKYVRQVLLDAKLIKRYENYTRR